MRSRFCTREWAALAAGFVVLSALAPRAQAQGAASGSVQISPNPTDFVAAAMRAIGAVDGGAAGPLWDADSPVLKGLEPRDSFTQTAAQRTAADGQVQNLQWTSINRIHAPAPQGKLPAGDYVTVGLLGLNKSQKAVFEEVSFVLDKDNVWRLVGISER